MPFFPRKSTLAATLAAAALLLPALPAGAQSWAGKGRLQGEVTSADGKPVAGAKVTLRKGDSAVDPKADGPKPVTTNDRGKWSILGLTQGAWGVLIEKEGFEDSEGRVQVNEFGINPPIRVTLAAGAAPAPAAAPAPQKPAASSADDPGATFERGNALVQEGKFAEARAEYEKALPGLQPASQARVLLSIAETYGREKKTDEAIATIRKALEIQPDNPASHKLLGGVLIDAGIQLYNANKLQEALDQFTQATEADPASADAFYYRGLAHLGLNQSAEAKAGFQKALELDPKHPKAAEIKEFISSL